MKTYILRLAIRYISSRQNNRFINFISLTSVIGIMLGVTVLITVLSIMNGFQSELRTRILDMTSHMTISQHDNQLRDWTEVRESLLEHPDIIGVSPFIQKQALITFGKNVKGVLIKGIDPILENSVSKIGNHLISGHLDSLQAGTFNIVLGQHLALDLDVSVGDKITVVIPQTNFSLISSLPRLKRFTVTGIFSAGMYEYDSGYAYIHLEDAAKLYSLRDAVNGLQIHTSDIFQVDRVTKTLHQHLPIGPFFATTWTQHHSNFFQAIQLEKRMMFIVLALIITIAAFNIVTTMVMMVNEKTRAIAILRSQGSTTFDITALFIIQGILLGTIGTLMGIAGGTALATNIDIIVPWLEQLIGIQFFPADVYYISKVPSQLRQSDVLEVSLFAFIMTVLATIYPAIRAAQVKPAQVLRYE